MAVPIDVRAIIGRREWDVSLQTDSASEAGRLARDHKARWKEEVRIARASLATPTIDLADVRMRLGSIAWAGWLLARFAHGVDDPRPAALLTDASNSGLQSPPVVSLRIATLRHALRSGIWTGVQHFEAVVADMLRIAEIDTHPSHPQYDDLCRIVAETWLASLEAEERHRLVHATQARSTELADPRIRSADVLPITLEAAYTPRQGDRTVADLIAAYRSARTAEYGERETLKRYSHIFSALETTLGADTILRTVTREDCRRIRDFLRRVPSNASKKYKGLSLADAIAKGEVDGADTIAPNTLNTYLSNLVAAMNWAVREDWLDKNPASGIVLKNAPQVKRRGFEAEELKTLFNRLRRYRTEEPWKWWIPAIGLYTGARLTEICQLRRTDVRRAHDINYLALTVFDDAGQRAKDKRLKTDASERNVPIHPALEGLTTVAEQSCGPLLFPALPVGPRGTATIVSQWFGRELEAACLGDRALVFHSFRHGFRDACEVAQISDRTIKALGGWASANVADRYGNAGFLPVLRDAVHKIAYGHFAL